MIYDISNSKVSDIHSPLLDPPRYKYTYFFSNFENSGPIIYAKTELSGENYSRYDFPVVSRSMVLPQVGIDIQQL